MYSTHKVLQMFFFFLQMLYDFHVFHTPGSSAAIFPSFAASPSCAACHLFKKKKKVNINQKIPSRPQKSPTYPQKKLFMSAKEPHTFTYEPYIYLRRHRVPPLFQKKKIHCTQERPRLSVAYVFLCV